MSGRSFILCTSELEKEELLERKEAKIELTRRGLLEVDHFLSEFFEPELRSVRYV